MVYRGGRKPSKNEVVGDRLLVTSYTHGVVASFISPEDAGRVAAERWRVNETSPGSLRIAHQLTGVHLSRFLMDCPKGLVVDHIDGDPLNNRRGNLRIVTQGENSQNRELTFGVERREGARGIRWLAYAAVRTKKIHLGSFDDEHTAASVSASWRAQHMPFSRF